MTTAEKTATYIISIELSDGTIVTRTRDRAGYMRFLRFAERALVNIADVQKVEA